MTDLAAAGLLVLDLDGTLIDLRIDWPRLRSEVRAIGERHGLELRERGVMAMLTEARSQGAPEAREEMEAAARNAEVGALAHSPVNRALVELVEALDPAPPLAILSLQSSAAVRRAVELLGWSDRVEWALGRDDVERPKPEPDGLVALAELHGVDPRAVVLVGDSDNDFDCARAAGARAVDVAELGVDWR